MRHQREIEREEKKKNDDLLSGGNIVYAVSQERET